MCLAVPMKLIEIKGNLGTVESGKVRREVDLQFLKNVKKGDYIIVHAGFALQRLDEEDALQTLELFRQMGEMTQSE